MSTESAAPYPFRHPTESGPFEVVVTRLYPSSNGYREHSEALAVLPSTQGQARDIVAKLEECAELDRQRGIVGGKFVRAEIRPARSFPFTHAALETYREVERVRREEYEADLTEYVRLLREWRNNRAAQGVAA